MPSRRSDIERYDATHEGWLLDTNVIGAAVGARAVPPGIEHFFSHVADRRLRLSVLTIGEIQKGILRLSARGESNAVSRGAILEKKLSQLEAVWSDRILHVDSAVAKKWGELSAEYENRGTPIPAIDGLIAATAAVHRLVVVSHDAAFTRMRDHIALYDPLSYA